ncbi:MAG: dolichol kinase [FCB group bacterium]|nr:dolichol kinase [FCB group bacterium]
MVTVSELLRKSIHLFNSVIPLGYLFIVPERKDMAVLLGILSILFFSIDVGRTRITWIRNLFRKLFDFMLRSHELEGRFTGATWVVIGSFLTVLLFPKNIAVLALFYLSFGDTAAALVGMQFGKVKFWNKSLEGTLAGLAACLLVAAFFPAVSWAVRFSGAAGAMLIELLPIPIDDNLRIPLVSGTIMLAVSLLVA